MTYLRFIARRERIYSTLWVGLMVVLTWMIAAMYPALMGDETTKATMVELLKSPAMVGMMGPVYGTDAYTPGVAFAQMMGVWVMMAAAVMNIAFVIRHTRADEEQGRLEMLRSLPIGRLANSAAVIAGVVLLNLVIAVLSTLALASVRLEGGTLAGAAAYSLEIAAFGLVMAAVTLLCAQLFSTSRGATGAAYALLGLFYLLRAAGDYSDGLLAYLSPMGLALRVYAFYENNVNPILILFLEAAVLILIALLIGVRRDLGEGVIPARRGRAFAKKSLLSPFGLALRLTKNAAIVWCAVLFAVAAMYGSMLGDIDGFIESNDFFKQLLMLDGQAADGLTNSFISLLFLIMSHIAVLPVIFITGKLRAEEVHGRMEPIFARAVKRTKLLAAFGLIALAESVLVSLSTALGLYTVCYGLEVVTLGSLIQAALCYLPAMWVFIGLSICLTGVLPKGGAVVWLLYAYSFGVLYLGNLLQLPDILQKLTPFGHIPQLPVQAFSITPLLILTALAALLSALGIWRFGRRDLG